MNEIINLLASDGTTVRFYNEIKASGGMKDVYFSPDRSYVVAFFRDKNNAATKERLAMITGQYRELFLINRMVIIGNHCIVGQRQLSSIKDV